MDSTSAIPGYLALAAVIAREILALVNHKRIRSVCCNRACASSLDVEATTPTDKEKPTP